MDTNLPHNLEERFRNIESHLGIGKVDEETGEYSVDAPEDKPAEPEPEAVETGEHEDEV